MSQTPMGSGPMQGRPLEYQVAAGWQERDAGHLTALSVCHYVFGGMTILFSCIFIAHIVMGAMIASGNFPMMPITTTQPAQASAVAQLNHTMQWMGWIFVVVGSCAVVLGWTMGILAICSGVCIARRRKRTFSLVVAAICCMMMPLGTALGIFTFIVLLRDSVKRMYEARI